MTSECEMRRKHPPNSTIFRRRWCLSPKQVGVRLQHIYQTPYCLGGAWASSRSTFGQGALSKSDRARLNAMTSNHVCLQAPLDLPDSLGHEERSRVSRVYRIRVMHKNAAIVDHSLADSNDLRTRCHSVSDGVTLCPL